jgi:hypothetical protein
MWDFAVPRKEHELGVRALFICITIEKAGDTVSGKNGIPQ